MPQNDPSSAFAAATAVRRAEGGGIVADLDPGWDVGGGILNGGYLLAVVGAGRGRSTARIRTRWRCRRAICARPAAGTGDPHGHARAGRPDAGARSVVLAGAEGPTLSAQVTTATLGDDAPVYSGPMPDVPPVGGVPLRAGRRRPRRPPGAGGGPAQPGRDPAGPGDRGLGVGRPRASRSCALGCG